MTRGSGGARSVVTIGAFDGVHRGHRQVITEVLRTAEAGVDGSGPLWSVVVTFDRHPAEVVRPESAPLLITDLEQKLELLAASGVGEVLVIPFDEERAKESAEDFVREVLVGTLEARVVIVGKDFHFGHGRRGNVELLGRMGGELGFEVVPYELVADELLGGVVSSTRIRGLISLGEMEAVAELLGRPHEIRGELAAAASRQEGPDLVRLVVQVPAGIAAPATGAYEVSVMIPGQRSSGIARVEPHRGRRAPTVIEVDVALSTVPDAGTVRVLFEKSVEPVEASLGAEASDFS